MNMKPPIQVDAARIEAIVDEPNPWRAEEMLKAYVCELRSLSEARKALEAMRKAPGRSRRNLPIRSKQE